MSQKEELSVDFFRNRFILRELEQGDNRSVILLGGAILDELLRRLLDSWLVPNNKIKTSVFDYTGALGTFANRINMCFLLGLISKDMFDDLNKVRDIRNCYAHNIFVPDFENDEIKNKCNSLILVKHQKVLEQWLTGKGCRERFVMGVVCLEIALVKKIVRIETLQEHESEVSNLRFEQIDWDYMDGKLNANK